MKNDIFSLKGKVAIITGGNQGIGKIVAEFLADAGADIAIFDLSDAGAVAVWIEKEYGVKAKAYRCDVTDPAQVEASIQQAGSEMGTLDLLFNNAGICLPKQALECSANEWRKVIDVNLSGVFYVAQSFARYLVKNSKGGNIVNTASMSGIIVNLPPCQASYNTSKAGVVHLTKSLAVELAPRGIRVNSISPGYIKTAMTAAASKDLQDTWINMTPFKRMGLPEELAGAVIYLLSNASTYTSGTDIIIDGCYTAI